jgi:pyridoxamine 5'-phosphate oxidase
VVFPDVDSDPMQFLSAWLQAARDAGEPLPEAMTLATIGPEGWPAARLVMLRGVDRGVVFFTDRESDKGLELTAIPRAAAVLHWLAPRHRQVRLVGEAESVSGGEAEAYWQSRRPEARRTAAASVQSRVITGRAELEKRVKELEQRFPDGVDLPRPSRWSGYRIIPGTIEFWEEAADGLHIRLRYQHGEAGWTAERLSP